MSFTPDSTEVVVSYGGKIWRVPIAEGREPVAVPFRVQTELDIGPELAFKYPVSNAASLRSAKFVMPFHRQTGQSWPLPHSTSYMLCPSGWGPRRLTSLEVVEAQPTWSPDGSG
ncbi:MAG: hypothetical protein Ct9H300mP25_15800 [Acidobacteriota bacterium]|nr:MAG: hypothetical protein Ct9H300mP25_15800 [Acidobacteriota bacterium]